MSEYQCGPDCCDEAGPELEPCGHPDWTATLRCVECGEPLTFENCGPWGDR